MKNKLFAIPIISMMALPMAYADHDVLLDQVSVRGAKTNEILPTYPSVTSLVEAKEIAETINAVDAPDVLKYLPNIFVRKRDSADYTGAPIASRIWGASYSAKSIVNVDGVPISNQLFNDNTYGTPKWYVTSPEEIRIAEVMYGPYSAAYSGNSMGAVVNIATKMPTEFTAVTSVTGALQTYNKFGTNDNYLTGVAHVYLGDKSDRLSWRVSLTHDDAQTQPRLFTTGSTASAYPWVKKDGTTGSYYDGAASLIHGVSDSVNLKVAFDLTSDLRLIVSPGIWFGKQDARQQTYINSYVVNTATSAYAFGLNQEHYVNSIALQSSKDKNFNWEFVASNYYYGTNLQRWSANYNLDGSMNTSGPGFIADYHGTQWTNIDWRSNYRYSDAHTFSLGAHYDYNKLNSRVATINSGWSSASANDGVDSSVARGVTETRALWVQDAWKLSDFLKLTTGLRAESWHATDGYVFAAASGSKPAVSSSPDHLNHDALSPKLSLSWDLQNSWMTTMSYGRATRFPTTGELYAVSSASLGVNGAATTSSPRLVPPAGNLAPEKVDSLELSFENFGHSGDFRATFFAQDVKDALLSTLGVLDATQPNVYYSYWQNVKKVRNLGVELYANQKNVLVHGLDLNGSITYVKSEILDSYGQLNTLGKSIVGNPVPYVPPWRLTAMATYRPDAKMTYTVAARYQKAGASSLENNDVNPNTYYGFASYFVVDAKVSYKIDKNWRASLGVDNLLNRDYFIFHPFPQRTFIANLKYTY